MMTSNVTRGTALALVLGAGLVGCGDDQEPSSAQEDAPGAVEAPSPPRDQSAAPGSGQESRLSREGKEWTEQTRELGAAAVESGKEAAKELSEKGGAAWQDIKEGSSELYEKAKEKGAGAYDATKEKGQQAMDYVKEHYQETTREDGTGGER